MVYNLRNAAALTFAKKWDSEEKRGRDRAEEKKCVLIFL
jgi:hypothetical protein